MSNDDFTYKQGQDYLTAPILAERVLWDSVPHPFIESNATALGLAPMSPEGLHNAHVQSHVRTDALKELLALTGVLSGLSYDAMTRAILVGRGSVELPREIRPLMFTACVAVIANLVDLGALAVPADDSENN